MTTLQCATRRTRAPLSRAHFCNCLCRKPGTGGGLGPLSEPGSATRRRPLGGILQADDVAFEAEVGILPGCLPQMLLPGEHDTRLKNGLRIRVRPRTPLREDAAPFRPPTAYAPPFRRMLVNKDRMTVLAAMMDQGVIPVFYHPD